MNPALRQILSGSSGIPRRGLVCWHHYWTPNVLLQSNAFNVWTQARSSAVQSASVLAPSGSSAWKLVEDNTAANSHNVNLTRTFTAGAWSFRMWMKKAERTWGRLTLYDGTNFAHAYYNLDAGIVGTVTAGVTATCQPLAGGYDCLLSATMASGSGLYGGYIAEADNDVTFDGTGSAPYTEADPGLYIADAQLYPSASLPAYASTTDLQSWLDLSGHGYPMQRGATANAEASDPTVLGLGLGFGSGIYGQTATLPVSPGSPVTIVVAVASAATSGFIFGLGSAANNFVAVQLGAAGATFGISGGGISTGPLARSGAGELFALVGHGNGLPLRLGQLSAGAWATESAALNNAGGSSPLMLGVNRSGGSTYMSSGTVYSDLFYNRVLNAAELRRAGNAICDYWAARGVTIARPL